MDESIKVYTPKKWRDIQEQLDEWNAIMVDQPRTERKECKKLEKAVRVEHNKFPWKKEDKIETLEQVLTGKEASIHVLEEKHPWVPVFYKRLFISAAVLLLLSFVWWGIMIFADNKASAAYENGVTVTEEAHQAAADAKQRAEDEKAQSLETRKANDIALMSKFLAGIQGFVENLGYTDADLETYGQCPINRVLNERDFPAVTSLSEAIQQHESWWVGFSMNNRPTETHERIAKKLVERYYNEEAMPCSASYCWTEFTDNGLWLKSDYGPATFSNTWRAN